MNIILLGIQGSGKSTQGNLLSTSLGVPYLSTGQIFREIAKEDTELAQEIKKVMNAGYLIPDAKTIEVVSTYLSRPEYKKGYILDGFPRTVTQAKTFQNGADKAVYLEISDDEAMRRISGRSEKRDDETPDAIKRRIDSFHEFTEPVLDFYNKKGQLVRVDGKQEIESIHQEIMEKLKK